MSTLTRAGWLIIRRMRADWLVVGVTFVTVLLVTTLLAAGPIYADGVAVAGLQRTLRDAPATDAGIEIAVNAPATTYAEADGEVQRQLETVLRETGGDVVGTGTSGPYNLLDREAESDIAVFMFLDDLPNHAQLIAGTWPEAAGGDIEIALSDGAAAQLDLQVGDRVATESRLEERRPSVVVSGIYQPLDAADPYWGDDPLLVDGIVTGQSVTTYGPFVVPEAVFIDELAPRLPSFHWRVLPDFERLSLGGAADLRAEIRALERQLNANAASGQSFSVESGLPEMLAAAERSLLATRAGVLIPTIQLGFLAGYALILTTGLLLLHRRGQTTLFWARGASRRFVLLVTLGEGLLLALPAALAGPWLASVVLRLLNHAGPLASIGLELPTTVNRTAYLLAGLAALGCVVILTLPVWSAARSVMGEQASRGREGRRAAWQRAGLDIGLLVVAAVAFTQLRRFGSPLTETVQGRLEVDPLLVAAPALGMLAGAIIALRLLPLLSRLADRAAPRSRSLVPVLVFWQVARRPLRYGRSALLLMLALGIGLFALAYTRTWEQSQQDQADYQVGADVSVRPGQGSASVPGTHLNAAYWKLDGVSQVTAMRQGTTSLPGDLGPADLILLDSAAAGETVRLREDLTDEPLPVLMDRLAERRPEAPGIALPGEPERLALEIRAMIQSACPPTEEDEAAAEEGSDEEAELPVIGGLPCAPVNLAGEEVYRQFDRPLTPAVVLRDASGQFFRLTGEPLESSPDPQRAVFPLAEPVAGGQVSHPHYPLELVAIELATTAPPEPDGFSSRQGRVLGARDGQFILDAILVSGQRSGDGWRSVPFDSDPATWELDSEQPPVHLAGSPVIGVADSDDLDAGLAVDLRTGSVSRGFDFMPYELVRLTFRLQPAGADVPDVLPVIVNERFLMSVTLDVGDRFLLDLDSEDLDAEIVGVVDAFPTTGLDADPLLLADLPTVNALQLDEPGERFRPADAYWLAVGAEQAGHVTTQLQAPPFSSRDAVSRFERAASMQSDPIALGTIGALTFGFVAAVVFAWIGFIANAAVSTRERFGEFALLRSLGLGRGQLTGWLLLEQGTLLGLSLVGGGLLGLLLAWLTFPLITVSQAATRVFPAVEVVIPWLSVLWLNLAVVGVLVVVAAVLIVVLRRLGLGSVLRHGEV